MYLFSRALTLGGSPRQTLPWVVEITEYVNANSPLDFTAWVADFGHPVGTVAWNTLAESQSLLAEGAMALAGQDGYLDLVEAAANMATAPGEDALRELVHGSPSEPPAIGSVAQVTTATMVVDKVADAMAWSVDMAEQVEKATGNPTSVWSSAYGQMGEVSWIGVVDGPAAADAARTALNGDAGYMERLKATGELFIPGSGHVARFTRIA